ncbi:MAG: hypothetical protein LWW93_05200 [Hyphomicrobiales bacterium]|nr:hypothetical protein [Hyphomicrobiales bacterium]
MANDTGGFRFLVEQIQLRDREEEVERGGPKTRSGRPDRRAEAARPTEFGRQERPRDVGLLSRRWL